MKEESFWSRVNKNGPVVRDELGPCWLWTGSQRSGYGVFCERRKDDYRKQRTVSAHRRAWELEKGEIPEGIVLCHRCDVRLCVRPSHLFLGSQLDNMEDMKKKGRSIALLTNDQAKELREAAWAGMNISEYKNKFGVSISTITRSIRGKSHSHITDPAPFLGDLDFSGPREGLKLNQDQVVEICQALERPYHGQQKYLAQKYGVSRTIIAQIGKGAIYQHAIGVYHRMRACA